MYTYIYHEHAISELKQVCDSNTHQSAIATSLQINKSIHLKTSRMQPVEKLLYSQDLYRRISNVYSMIFSLTEEQRCYYTHVLVGLQSMLRDISLGVIEEQGVMSDFANIWWWNHFQWAEFKETLIQHYNNKYSNAAINLPSATRIQAPRLEIESEIEKKLATPLIKLTTNMIYDTINDMYTQRFISEAEAELLLSKITLHYIPNTCTSFHGRFSVSYKIKNWIKGHTSVDGVDININGCYNIFVISDLENIIKTLTLHEIGGHMSHYIKDDYREEFQKICWINSDTRNDSCLNSDFVSPYATTNAFEDYAETFAYRRQDKMDTSSQALKQKYNYMRNMTHRVRTEN